MPLSKANLITKVVSQEALESISAKLVDNVWAISSRDHPNASRLQDGAIQRMSVSQDRYNLHPSQNVEKVGFYKRPELNERIGGTDHCRSDPSLDNTAYINRIVRIYQKQKNHTQMNPYEKYTEKGWCLEFQNWGTFHSPLMLWSNGTLDPVDHFSNPKFKVGSLSAAVSMCDAMGWGYDIQYPNNRWHSRKSYSDNFKWKGKAQEEEPYD
ncbi:nadh dehydrogenase fe-s protein [Stylonychia lemnae]|uniref:NADH dehydrogenase [ubiquinone] iron-sulfur protein 4, mitochondrial n=1 Tax=Stylonychia lemnae TaxID=5949 RepID=A0A078AH95_STYLE|nr:nadh dehydrogenase fe-s protein [Stylonychia lemnae]|eukprot:CDW81660.1 nadh dehydrogenase fe-s protein [Stylonychia lemnae]